MQCDRNITIIVRLHFTLLKCLSQVTILISYLWVFNLINLQKYYRLIQGFPEQFSFWRGSGVSWRNCQSHYSGMWDTFRIHTNHQLIILWLIRFNFYKSLYRSTLRMMTINNVKTTGRGAFHCKQLSGILYLFSTISIPQPQTVLTGQTSAVSETLN